MLDVMKRIDKDFLFFDGGFGTQLQAAGMKAGQIPEELNIDNPNLVKSIHKRYLDAGSDFISTNTFGCNRIKMTGAKYSVSEMINAAVTNAECARAEAGREQDAYIVLDIGPVGTMLKPLGTLEFEEAVSIIAEQIEAAGDRVDAILFETMTDIHEVKAGILAAREHSNLPIFTSMTFEKSGRTLTGTDVESYVNVAESLGASMIGVNCSLGPVELAPIIEDMLKFSHVPVFAQPNAGLPKYENGETRYVLSADDFAAGLKDFVYGGLSACGGCCGTTPDYIRAVKAICPKSPVRRNNDYVTKVSSGNKTVSFDGHVIVCGERLNPTGKKKMQAALLEGRLDEIIEEAIRQEDAGAEVLDVNVGLPGINEKEMMLRLIPMLQEVVNVPLQIDSSEPEAIEAACRIYNGRPLINSVNGKKSIQDAILPIVKKYGGVVIGLTLSDEVPVYCEQRVQIATDIIERAQEEGIRKEDVIIDCLTLTASAQQKEVKETLKAVRTIRNMGHHAVLGVSNVSFGLPNRGLLNRTFLAMAIEAGLDLPIMNPLDADMMGIVDAANLLGNYDINGEKYIEKHAGDAAKVNITQSSADKKQDARKESDDKIMDESAGIARCIEKGLKSTVSSVTRETLNDTDPMEIINETIIPALNKVGKDYEAGVIFLPQLIQAAETAKLSFDVIKEAFSQSGEKKGPVVICTVEGDIHDIGKNIVKVVLESYGYEIIDLGKDVKPEAVLEAYNKYSPVAIGLSALMTTTVVNMKKTIEVLKQSGCKCPVWVGGAVLTESIASEIGADYYTEDAMASVRLLEQLI